MIQLASDPNASRTGFRPGPAEAKSVSTESRRGRSGHAWPFISRHGEKPAVQEPAKNTSSTSGS